MAAQQLALDLRRLLGCWMERWAEGLHHHAREPLLHKAGPLGRIRSRSRSRSPSRSRRWRRAPAAAGAAATDDGVEAGAEPELSAEDVQMLVGVTGKPGEACRRAPALAGGDLQAAAVQLLVPSRAGGAERRGPPAPAAAAALGCRRGPQPARRRAASPRRRSSARR